MAANCLERGDEASALPHLTAHVTARPDAIMIRAYLAELLLKLGRADEARSHFERYVHDAGRLGGASETQLVHCHTRLMELAQQADDEYREHLHRGVGLLLLVRQWEAEPDRDMSLAEPTLAKAAEALREAVRLRPTDPSIFLYLSDVYARLGQPSAARSVARRGTQFLPDPALSAEEADRLVRAAE